MWKGKQHQTQHHPPKKRHKKHNKKKEDQLSKEQETAKCVSIETQLRLQREKSATATITSAATGSQKAEQQSQQTGPAVVKGFVYDSEKQRYFRAPDKKIARSRVIPGAGGCLPQALSAKCSFSLPSRVNPFSIVGFLHRQQLNHGVSMNYSPVLARTMQVRDRGAVDSAVKHLHFHPLFGKVLTLERSLVFLRAGFDSVYMQHPAPSAALSFVTAKWAPSPFALVGAVLCDHRGMHRVVVLRPDVSQDDDEGRGSPVHAMPRQMPQRLISSTVLELKRTVSNVHWTTSGGPTTAAARSVTGADADAVRTSRVMELELELELELVVCSEDAVYRIAWPTCQVTRLCAVSSPAVCFAPISAATMPHSSNTSGGSGVLGLRNGSIFLTDPRMHSASCTGAHSTDGSSDSGSSSRNSSGNSSGSGSGSGSGSKKHGLRHTPRPSSSSSSASSSPLLLTRMKHCIDHLHTLQHSPTVLAQDVVGNVSLFDLRRASHAAVTIVVQPPVASHLLQGSLFWVSPDEEMVLVNARIDTPDSHHHSRAIDIWSVTHSAQRHHQVPIPRGCSGSGFGPALQEDGGSGSINTLRFAPNIGWAACLSPRPYDSSSSSSSSNLHGRDRGDRGDRGGSSLSSYGVLPPQSPMMASGDETHYHNYRGFDAENGNNGENVWRGASVACFAPTASGRLGSSLFDMWGR